jgi:hypothetical protein
MKWMNYVDESSLTPPKQFTGICREVGHSGDDLEVESVEHSDFKEFLAGFMMI